MTDLSALLAPHPLPDRSGGKDDNRTIVIVGGPPSCPGAVRLAGAAALRVGSGRVQLIVDSTVAPGLAVLFPEVAVMSCDQADPLPDAVSAQLRGATTVVVGPGHDAMASDAIRAIALASPRRRSSGRSSA
jgi:NAD(P)H-hydrate repair Nnr-like enzyme with NAD(P)H-hydrate dehydratase domain